MLKELESDDPPRCPSRRVQSSCSNGVCGLARPLEPGMRIEDLDCACVSPSAATSQFVSVSDLLSIPFNQESVDAWCRFTRSISGSDVVPPVADPAILESDNRQEFRASGDFNNVEVKVEAKEEFQITASPAVTSTVRPKVESNTYFSPEIVSETW